VCLGARLCVYTCVRESERECVHCICRCLITVKVDISACGNFCFLSHQSIRDVNIFAIINNPDFTLYYILYLFALIW